MKVQKRDKEGELSKELRGVLDGRVHGKNRVT